MYEANATRYDSMPYRYCGKSGLALPVISVGLWQNFGDSADEAEMRDILLTAFDHGVTHFDLANNYGPAPGAAERNFGKILKRDLLPYRDELIISTKAGYEMWPGPYGGRGGSRKYLTASLDQSLRRLGLAYVDIFYHHCMTPETPLGETALCLSDLVRQGKTLYVGLSNYDGEQMQRMHKKCKKLHVPFLLNQNRYSLFDKTIEQNGLKTESAEAQKGILAFSPLAQGQLADKYANGIPAGSRLYNNPVLWKKIGYDEARQAQIRALYTLAKERGQTLSQLAIQWLLEAGGVTGVLIGVHTKAQLLENLAALDFPPLTDEELSMINRITDKKFS